MIFYFWRNRGRSKKSEDSRGRWGLGKLVFPHSSQINTFFGLTKRDDDKESYLMGTADLKFTSMKVKDMVVLLFTVGMKMSCKF